MWYLFEIQKYGISNKRFRKQKRLGRKRVLSLPKLTTHKCNACVHQMITDFMSEALVSEHFQFISGDWAGMKDIVKDLSVDIILAAETVYRESDHIHLIELIKMLLDRQPCIAILSQKEYYFGVGGSLQSFLAKAGDVGIKFEILERISDGSSNVRTIVKLSDGIRM